MSLRMIVKVSPIPCSFLHHSYVGKDECYDYADGLAMMMTAMEHGRSGLGIPKE
jgi:hypothetical protein